MVRGGQFITYLLTKSVVLQFHVLHSFCQDPRTNVTFSNKAYTCTQAQSIKHRFPYPEIIPTLGVDLEQCCFLEQLFLSPPLPLSIVIKVRKISLFFNFEVF